MIIMGVTNVAQIPKPNNAIAASCGKKRAIMSKAERIDKVVPEETVDSNNFDITVEHERKQFPQKNFVSSPGACKKRCRGRKVDNVDGLLMGIQNDPLCIPKGL